MQKKSEYGMNLSIQHHLYSNTSKDSSLKDYYPFGMVMPERNFSYENYRFGFNGKENDDEVKGNGNQQDYGMRTYDNRIGRFLSVDPITAQYPELTPYQFASNSPIWGIDWDGLELRIYTSTQGLIGHTFLTVGKDKDLVVYSYGQYGAPKYESLAGNSPKGQGVLYRYTGKRATDFLKTYVNVEGAQAYEIKDADEQKAKENFDQQFYSGYIPLEGRAEGDKDARVISEAYNVLENNCATITCETTENAGSSLSFEKTETTILPSGPSIITTTDKVNTPKKMEDFLKRESNTNNNIINVTPIVKEELNSPK